MSPHPKTVEELLSEVRKENCRINNLFHRMDGLWQANLRSRDNMQFFEFGYGPSPQDALEKALEKVRKNLRVGKTMPDDDNRDPTNVGSTKEPVGQVAQHPIVEKDNLIGDEFDAVKDATVYVNEDEDLIG